MTLVLGVDTARWNAHVDRVVAETPRLIPVIKGNGYGFGRATLAARCAGFADLMAVGTVYEVAGLAADRVVVLTPTLDLGPLDAVDGSVDGDPVLTVASPAHIAAAAGRPRRVVVKIASSMQRYGGEIGLVAAARAAGLEVVAVSIHPPLPSTPADRLGDVVRRLHDIPTDLEVWVSHLDPAEVRALPDSHRYRLRVGTRLWHGDKSMLHLGADVLEVRPVTAGSTAGYRQTRVDVDGSLVMIGCGSAHGVGPLPDGRSPFHHARTRLDLLEPPHMHTSMVEVAAGSPCPDVGEIVDVQQPLTRVVPDVVDWR